MTKVIDAMNCHNIIQLNQLTNVEGVGNKTLEKILILENSELEATTQLSLLDI